MMESNGKERVAKVVDNSPKVMPVTKSSKIGRNVPCPCGSKIKYKYCCLDKREYNPGV